MPDDVTTQGANLPSFERDENFISLYANNVRFEISTWDMKMIFGQLDQSQTPNVVEQHTAITMAWPQLKIAAYYLIVNMIVHTVTDGPIQLPATVVPQKPNTSDESLDENGKRAAAYISWIHDQFFGATPYAPPGAEAINF
jgi:hypothetical protein